MPSKNTSVIAARVKDEIAVKLEEIAENKGISIAKLIEEMTENYEDKKGVTPISYGLSDNFSDKIYEILTDKGYPDRAIDQMKEAIISSVKESPKYDARRAREEWC